jgi:hypothetical protein
MYYVDSYALIYLLLHTYMYNLIWHSTNIYYYFRKREELLQSIQELKRQLKSSHMIVQDKSVIVNMLSQTLLTSSQSSAIIEIASPLIDMRDHSIRQKDDIINESLKRLKEVYFFIFSPLISLSQISLI